MFDNGVMTDDGHRQSLTETLMELRQQAARNIPLGGDEIDDTADYLGIQFRALWQAIEILAGRIESLGR
jgi:hypothetical protein